MKIKVEGNFVHVKLKPGCSKIHPDDLKIIP